MGESQLKTTILNLINDAAEPLDTLKIASSLGQKHDDIVGAVKSLQTVDNLIDVKPCSLKLWELTDEGKRVSQNGKQFYSSMVLNMYDQLRSSKRDSNH